MKKQRWFLPTNTENLELFISQGLITCADGLNAAYIQDVMHGYPDGYIPFFVENNLIDALEKSRIKDENLTACLIELDSSQILSMSIFAELDSNSTNADNYEVLDISDINEIVDIKIILLPSPLPLQCIKNVIFENAAVKNEVVKHLENGLGIYSGKFFLSGGVNSKLFKPIISNTQTSFDGDSLRSHESVCIQKNDVNYNKIFSLGGMLGLMYYQSKNGQESVSYFNEACSLAGITNHKDKEFELMNRFFYDVTPINDEYDLLNFNLLKILRDNRGSIGEVRQEIIDYLKSTEGFPESRKMIVGIADRLQKIVDRHEDYMAPEKVFSKIMASYSAIEDKEQKKIIMILVMYFFRDNIETMFKFYHESFQQIDYILFSMFFGIGSQYLNMPSHIKKIKGLAFYISNRMSEYHHFTSNDAQTFKKVVHPKFLMKDLIKENTNGERDKFVDWLSEIISLNSKLFQSWEIKPKGQYCVVKSLLTFNEKPDLIAKIDMENIEEQMLVSTINNDKDLFDYNEVFKKYEQLVK